MRYLLDTHVFLWWLSSDKRLKERWKQVISDSQNEIFISAVSAWEIVIKLQLGKLKIETSLADCFKDTNFTVLDISLDHVFNLSQLPLKHKDPFDRMLIAQAMTEQCILITDDQKIKAYAVLVLDS